MAGLAWNQAIQSAINYLLPSHGGSLFGQLLYAIIITVVVVVLIRLLGKVLRVK